VRAPSCAALRLACRTTRSRRWDLARRPAPGLAGSRSPGDRPRRRRSGDVVAVMRERRLGIGALVLGGLAIIAVQRVAPLLAPPLYDGVIVIERYRWLVPPPGQPGDPKSATGT